MSYEHKVKVRKLLQYTPQEVAARLKSHATLVFEDGVEIQATFREIILDRYLWTLLEKYPIVPIKSAFHIANYYNGGRYVSDTFNKTLEAIFDSIVLYVMEPNNSRAELKHVAQTMFNIFNDIYNEIGYGSLDYVGNLDIKEFLELMLDKRNVETMRAVEKLDIDLSTREKMKVIDANYQALDKIMTDGSYPNNKVADGYRSRTMNPTQVMQILGVRGIITDINGNIYKKPVGSGFGSGLYNIGELVMESQAAAKSQKATYTAVSLSEYFARRVQLVAARVERVIDGDCGQTDYIEWEVLPDSKDDYNPHKCHLPTLVGKYYLNEETGKEEAITSQHTHLIGKVIKLRVAYKCKCLDKRCICVKCLGKMAYNVFDHTHVGHLCATNVTEPISQGILSMKHKTASASSSSININVEARQDFEVKEGDDMHVYLRKKGVHIKLNGEKEFIFDNKKDFDLYIKVPNGSARGLADITPQTDVKRFAPSAVSVLWELFLVKVNKVTGEVIEIPVDIKKTGRCGSFTTHFLEHIQKVGYTIDAEEYLTIPINDWEYNHPIMILPDVEFNHLNFLNAVARLFGSSTMGMGAGRQKKEVEDDSETISTQEGFLHRLYAEVNNRLDINIAMFEVIVAAFSVANFEANDFGVGHGAPTASTRNIKTILHNTSAGGAYAYENHMDFMLNPGTFDLTNNVNHIMDVFLSPGEVIEEYNASPLPTR